MTRLTGTQETHAHSSTGGRLVAADGRVLPFGGAEVEARAAGGVAEVVLRHLFVNDGDVPLEATYQTPIPARAAVGGYAFSVGERRFVGKIEPRERARERYDEALLEGRSAALLDEQRETFFTQHIGNIPPGAEVICELRLDQRLDWTGGAWEWRFPTVIAPRYSGAPGRVEDAGAVELDVVEEGAPARVSVELRIEDAIGEASSPSHSITSGAEDEETVVRVSSENGARLDRDLAIVWPAASPKTALRLETSRPPLHDAASQAQYGLVTITPPASEAPSRPRDIIILIDTSGSMTGLPLERAKRTTLGLIQSLRPQDRLELVRFGSEAERWRDHPVAGASDALNAAREWVDRLEAGGGTEMQEGLKAALRPAQRAAQRQVVLITDGYVSFEREMIRLARSYRPGNVRVHAVGVGSAMNRSLTSAVAHAGGGREFQIELDGDPEAKIRRVAAQISASLVTNVKASGDALTEPVDLPDLMGGSPFVAALRLRPEGGTLVVRGEGPDGSWSEHIEVSPRKAGAGRGLVRRLVARDLVDRFELAEQRDGEFDKHIERIGLMHRIATRRTSWVAVSEVATVDEREPTKRVKIPQELPYGVSASGPGIVAEERSCLDSGECFKRAAQRPAAELRRNEKAALRQPRCPEPKRDRELGRLFRMHVASRSANRRR